MKKIAPAEGSGPDKLGVFAGCSNGKCPSAETCVRYVGIRESGQSVSGLFSPLSGQRRCEYYIPTKGAT